MNDVRAAEIEAALRALVARVEPEAEVMFEHHDVRPIGYSWDGRRLRVTGATYESRVHEIAHLLVAPASRRREPEFGLGPDPYRRGFVARTVSLEEADREELDACDLQLVIVRVLGLDEALTQSEYGTPPLTPERVRALRDRHPEALPPAWWERALERGG
ncbi:MAG: hypothetical protein M5U28_24675 [Sandaracinaceae bacterium]|nr:hypothetical protein [Sandaracinaceae bacterium]